MGSSLWPSSAAESRVWHWVLCSGCGRGLPMLVCAARATMVSPYFILYSFTLQFKADGGRVTEKDICMGGISRHIILSLGMRR